MENGREYTPSACFLSRCV